MSQLAVCLPPPLAVRKLVSMLRLDERSDLPHLCREPPGLSLPGRRMRNRSRSVTDRGMVGGGPYSGRLWSMRVIPCILTEKLYGRKARCELSEAEGFQRLRPLRCDLSTPAFRS